MPTGWFKWGNFENISGEKINSENSVGKVVSDKNGKFGCITYRFPANYAGDTIKLTGKIKYENVKEFVGLLMRIDGESKTRALGFKSMQNLKIRGTSDWKEYSIQLPYPPNAKYIFIGGILGKKGVAWFDDFKVTIDGVNIQDLEETERVTLKDYDGGKLASAISKSSYQVDISKIENLGIDSLIEKSGDKKIVAIGESTHGTSDFYRLRELITKRLITEKGFKLVVLESTYDDIELLNEKLDERSLDTLMRKHLFSIYQTNEMKSFLNWYKDNRSTYNISFKGCDDSNWVYLEFLKSKTDFKNDKELNNLLENLASHISKSSTDNLKKEVKIFNTIYNDILAIENHLKSTGTLTYEIEEVLFNIKNTFINYLHIKNNEPFQSRDEIMAERISFLARNTNEKIIVWAHNAHISNQIISNEIGMMGRNLKKEFGENYYSIGLTTLDGTYSYMEEKFINEDHIFTEQLKTERLKPNQSTYWEDILGQNGNSFFLDTSILYEILNTNDIIGPTKLIGYGKETEDDGYYIPLVKNFDGLIFLKTTRATTPIFN
ncbi:hypothetical protein Musp01_12240 [Muricauda sp. NBRC 101325]|nr:hypothetical protein Musp01_12240 [Muricauda sp. NBRC 101325]